MSFKTVRAAALVLSAALLLLLICQTQSAEAMTFQFTSTDPICFVEEVMEDTKAITGTYAWAGTQATANIALTLKLYDPTNTMVGVPIPMERGFHNLMMPMPRLQKPGRYLLCASVTENPSKLNLVETPVMVEFMIDQSFAPLKKDEEAALAVRKRVQGKEVFTYTDAGGQPKDILQPAEYLQKVTKALRALDREFTTVKRGMDNYLERQERMRSTAESTFSRVWKCAALTILVIIVVVFVQFRMLKGTIKRKKLI